MSEERVILSERLEDLIKAVEWGREQKKKLLNDKGKRPVEDQREIMTPLMLDIRIEWILPKPFWEVYRMV